MACYAITLVLLVWVGQVTGLGWVYYAGLVTAADIVLYHYSLIKNRSREACFADIALDYLVRTT